MTFPSNWNPGSDLSRGVLRKDCTYEEWGRERGRVYGTVDNLWTTSVPGTSGGSSPGVGWNHGGDRQVVWVR